jgi:glycosyltransferase involved in cell wall biosynthesis
LSKRFNTKAGHVKAIFFANTDWYLFNFRLDLAKFLRSRGWEVVFMAPPGDHFNQIEKQGFRQIPFEFSRKGINPIIEKRTIDRIAKIYCTEKPDLVHHFTVKCVIYGSMAAKKCGIPCIINSITGLGYVFLGTTLIARMIRRIATFLYKSALQHTQVIFENPDDAALFQKMSLVDENNFNVILGTGIDTDAFIPVPPPDSIPLVVLPARMLWDKGIGEFVGAAGLLREKGIKARFALVGRKDEGNPSSISYDQLTLWQKEGDVEWWGWQEDIITVLSMSDIVCLPSYREGLPKVLIEACSCSRPIVTTDVPGCKEVVLDQVNGLLVPAKQILPLADALEKLILDKDLRIQMGKEGRIRAVNIFSTTRVNSETLNVYQKAGCNP